MLVAGGPSSRLWSPDPTLRVLLDASPAASAIADRAGHLVHVNAAWRALGARTATFGGLGTLVTQEDLEGSAYARRLGALEGPLAPAAHKLARAIDEAVAGRASERIAYRMHRPEGEAAFEACALPLPGPVRLALVQHVDLADRDHALEAQAAAVEVGLVLEQVRAERRRTARRLEALGRDLHTPITPVRLQLHLLHQGRLGPLTERQRHALDVIERNVARWAQGEEAFPRLGREGWQPPGALDLAAAAAAAADDQRGHALRQGVRLVVTPPGRELRVRVSPDLLHDVLDQLLARAIEATPAGAAVALEARERDGEALAEVRDGGPGLSPRELRDVFEPWMGRRPGHGAASGFALAFLRATVVGAGGRMFAESDGPGGGVLLGVAFPLALPDAERDAGAEDAPPAADPAASVPPAAPARRRRAPKARA